MAHCYVNIRISQGLQGLRLDQVLARESQIVSRAQAQRLIEQGLVHLMPPDQNTTTPAATEKLKTASSSTKAVCKNLKASQKTICGQVYRVQVPAAAKTELQAYNFKLSIVYEDNQLIVIDKPAGLVVHPAPGHLQDTLLNALLYYGYKFIDDVKTTHPNMESLQNCNKSQAHNTEKSKQRLGIVHRLDKDTSGLIVVAKTKSAQQHLCLQFKNRKNIKRVYDCFVHGRVNEAQGTITSYLIRHPINRKTYCSLKKQQDDGPAQATARLAITHYKTKVRSDQVSCLECRLETGRTHQIRVHMKELGHPVIGDTIYTTKTAAWQDHQLGRLALHAKVLEFVHPASNKLMHFESPLPEELQALNFN